MWVKLRLLVCIFIGIECKKCVKWTDRFVDPDGPSMVYSETVSPEDGIGKQLSIFAFLWQLRRNYNVDVFISKITRDVLARVFTPESLSNMPVLEEYFCNPDEIDFEYFAGPFEAIAKRKEFRVGRTLWLWPSTEVVKSTVKKSGKIIVEGDDYDTKFRGYK